MIGIREVGYEDNKYDMCGNTTVAVLTVNNITISLCDECIKELIQSLEEFNNTLFCHKCPYFVMSEYGWRYGGSCKKWAVADGKEISNAGYNYCVDCMQRCRFIRDNTVYMIYGEHCGIPNCNSDCNKCKFSIWDYTTVPYNESHQSEIGKTIFLTEEEAKNKCDEIMENNSKKLIEKSDIN